MRPRNYILVFDGSGIAGVLGLMEGPAIADAKSVIHGEHHETMRRQILIHGVGVAVVIHVVPAEEHLPRWSAVHENYGGFRYGRPRHPVLEQLTMDAHPVGCLEDDALRHD